MSFLVGRARSAALASDSADARNVVLQTNKKPAANKASAAYSALLGAAMGGAAPSKPVRPVEEDDDEDVLPESAAPRVAQLAAPSDAWSATSPPPPAIDLGSEAVPAFIAAAAFGGARPGFSFRAGESGVGYYRDPRSGPVQAAAPPPPPPTLGLAELSLEEAEAAWASVQGVGVTSAAPLPPPPQPPPPGAAMTQPNPVVPPPAALVEPPPSTVPPPPPPPPTAAVAPPSTTVPRLSPPSDTATDTAATGAAAFTSAGASRAMAPPPPAARAAAAPAVVALARPGASASVEFGSMRAEREESSSEDEDDEDDEDGPHPSAGRAAGAAALPARARARRTSKDDSDGEVEFG